MDTNTNNPILLEWQAPSHVDHERSARWYGVAGVIALSLIAYGVFSGSWTMSVALAIACGLYFLVRNEKHRTHTIRILPMGIEFDGKIKSWNSWREFWILMGPDYTELHVASRGFSGDLVIQTGPVDPYRIRDVLAEFLPQNPQRRERLLDSISRFCKL